MTESSSLKSSHTVLVDGVRFYCPLSLRIYLYRLDISKTYIGVAFEYDSKPLIMPLLNMYLNFNCLKLKMLKINTF